ncbi:MAG: caspase family protein [Treponema sp.]|jgi:hypothetical protein|nr:caspase family protein [Treponema sp.]
MRSKVFIIGMTSYVDPQNVLQNCVNDANSIQDAFTQLGIDSTKITNAGIAKLKDARIQAVSATKT